MNNLRHWTPGYVKARISEAVYRRKFPANPWLTKTANTILSTYLKASDVGLEWGSGLSTLWFARRVSKLTSIEHDSVWYGCVKDLLCEQQLKNVDYVLCPYDKRADEQDGGRKSKYVEVGNSFATASLDFVLVDGVHRSACALLATNIVRPGGILIVDNINWFLPSQSQSPSSISTISEPLSEAWEQFAIRTEKWRLVWTSNGITDTAFWIRPCRKAGENT